MSVALKTAFLLLACAFLAPSAALAGAPVELRPDAAGHDGAVTLHDLFEGADGAAGSRIVGRAPVGSEAVLDAGEVQLAARSAGLDWANAAGQRRIIVAVVAGEAETPARTAGHVHRRAHASAVLVYSRNLSAGELIEASDLQWSEEAVAGPDAPGRVEAVIGMAARLPLREGAAVGAHDLVAPKVIRRDQMISVDYAQDGVSLSLTAKAMGDAAVGDAVEAMNLQSKKIIQAVATAPGHAVIGAAADAAQGALMQTASN